MSWGAKPRFSASERPDKASLPNGNLRYHVVIVPLLKIYYTARYGPHKSQKWIYKIKLLQIVSVIASIECLLYL